MDWNAVKELAGFYAAAGLADTRSGRFLTDVAESQTARGGAVSWLQALVENGDPRPWVALAAEISPHMDNAGPEGRYLPGIVSRLSEGKKAKDWEVAILDRVKARAVMTPQPLTDHQVRVLTAVDGNIHNGNIWYWNQRRGFHDKALRIVAESKEKNAIHPTDWDWIVSSFSSIVRGVETTAGEDGQIRFWRSPTGVKTVMVMGNGYYHKDKRVIVQDCMFEGKIEPIRSTHLLKRKPKEV